MNLTNLTGSSFADDTTQANMKKGILSRRKEWVGEDEAQQEMTEQVEQVETC